MVVVVEAGDRNPSKSKHLSSLSSLVTYPFNVSICVSSFHNSTVFTDHASFLTLLFCSGECRVNLEMQRRKSEHYDVNSVIVLFHFLDKSGHKSIYLEIESRQ